MADVVLAIIPMTFLRKLEMSRGRRVYLSVLLGLGSMLVNIRLFLAFSGTLNSLDAFLTCLLIFQGYNLRNRQDYRTLFDQRR